MHSLKLESRDRHFLSALNHTSMEEFGSDEGADDVFLHTLISVSPNVIKASISLRSPSTHRSLQTFSSSDVIPGQK